MKTHASQGELWVRSWNNKKLKKCRDLKIWVRGHSRSLNGIGISIRHRPFLRSLFSMFYYYCLYCCVLCVCLFHPFPQVFNMFFCVVLFFLSAVFCLFICLVLVWATSPELNRLIDWLIDFTIWPLVQSLTKIGWHILARQIGEVSVFFSYKHTINQSIKHFFSSRVQITNIENMLSIWSSKHVVSRTDVPFGGYNI